MIGKYFDYNATTPLREEVVDVLKEHIFTFGNPSSVHSLGRIAKSKVQEAKLQVCKLIGAGEDNQIIFTSSGTEAVNFALKGYLHAFEGENVHIITTQIEHPATLEVCQFYENRGVEVTYLPANKEGIVQIESLEQAMRPNTVLVSIMMANNETGAIQPIKQMIQTIKAINPHVFFHVDAVQAVGKIPVYVMDLGVDALSFSSHKLYGPKGVGALYMKDPTSLQPLVHGGGQENGWRGGTENVLGAIGFGIACSLAHEELHVQYDKMTKLKVYLLEKLQTSVADFYVNGTVDPSLSLPGTLNVSFAGIRSEALAAILNEIYGIAVSVGSACSSEKVKLSHVLQALGHSEDRIKSSLRISFGKYTTREDIDNLIQSLSQSVYTLRQMLPQVKEKV
jgi:cysteine desulfurase